MQSPSSSPLSSASQHASDRHLGTMSRLILNRPLWRFWATATVAALGIILLLTGVRWQSSRKKPTYFIPPEAVGTELEQQWDHVDGVGPGPELPIATSTGSGPPNQPVVPGGQAKMDDHGLSVEEAANATLGVNIHALKHPLHSVPTPPPQNHLTAP